MATSLPSRDWYSWPSDGALPNTLGARTRLPDVYTDELAAYVAQFGGDEALARERLLLLATPTRRAQVVRRTIPGEPARQIGMAESRAEDGSRGRKAVCGAAGICPSDCAERKRFRR